MYGFSNLQLGRFSELSRSTVLYDSLKVAERNVEVWKAKARNWERKHNELMEQQETRK